MAHCEALKSELDVFEIVPTQTSIEGGKWMTFKPISSLRGDAIEFNVPGSGNEYMDLALTYMYLKVKIVTDEKGTALDDTDIVGPSNNFMHTLINHAEVYLNGTLLSPSACSYAYRAYIETLLNFGRGAKESHLTSALWHKDTAGKMNSLTENQGFVKRKSFVAQSKELELYGPLFLDILNVEKFLLNGVDLRIKLSRSKANFALMGKPKIGADYRIIVTDASLLVRKVQIAPKILLAHEAALSKAAAKYTFTRTETKIFTINANIRNITIPNVYLGTLPIRLIIGLVDHDAYNGNLEKSPFVFDHHDLNSLALFVDSDSVDSKPLTPNYEGGQFIQAYHTLFTGSGIHYKNQGIDISRSEYPLGNALYAFDISQDLSASASHYWNPSRQGQLRLELGFAKEVPSTLSCVVFAEFQASFRVDKDRNVIIDNP